MSLRERIDRQVDELRAARDELQVRLHLGKMDAEELWQQIEKQWEHTEGKLKVLGDASQEAAEEVAQAAELVLEEIREGYAKLRKLL